MCAGYRSAVERLIIINQNQSHKQDPPPVWSDSSQEANVVEVTEWSQIHSHTVRSEEIAFTFNGPMWMYYEIRGFSKESRLSTDFNYCGVFDDWEIFSAACVELTATYHTKRRMQTIWKKSLVTQHWLAYTFLCIRTKTWIFFATTRIL